MAKKEIRMVTAEESLATLIDRGATIDVELKNLSFEDKGIKTKLGERVGSDFSEGEQSLRFDGNKARALVTRVDNVDINTGAEKFADVKLAIEKGLLKDVVEVSQKLTVPPAMIEQAAEILKAAGIAASLSTSYAVDPGAYRDLLSKSTSTVEDDEARKSLAASVEESMTFRVKYEIKQV